MELNQGTSINVIPASLINRMCAWCLTEAGEAAGDGSHGICERHAIEIYAAWRAERTARKDKPMA